MTHKDEDYFRFRVQDTYDAFNDRMNIISSIRGSIERLEQLEKNVKFSEKYVKEHTDMKDPKFNPDKIIEEYKRRRFCGCP